MDNFLEIIKKRKYLYFIMILLVISILALIGISKTFSMLEPVKSINITSSNLSYENNEPGSWNIEKSAKWIESSKARITFDLDTVLRTQNNKYVDIILVLDVSGSMNGEKLNKVKNDSIELVDYLLNDSNNRVGLITFESNSVLVSDLTNDKDTIIDYINNLSSTGSTNYYRALENVDNILKNYTKEEGRGCIVLFLTDGAPNRDIPNEVGEYEYLKKTYPYITINGVQYEMGDVVLDPIKTVSDNQYIASMDTLNNVLFDAVTVPIKYDSIEIVDYVDNNYFNIDSIDDIYSNIGEVNLDGNKVTWTINDSFRSGDKATLTIDVRLKDEFIDVGGIYPTNIKEEIKTKIEEDTENIISTDTPVLADNYMVIYDDNSPNGCSVSNKPVDEAHSVYTTVKKSEAIPECEGYIFKGWDVVTEDVEKVNDDYFIMPETDVTLRAEWSSLTINKSMDGTVAEDQSLYNLIRGDAILDSVNSTYVTGRYEEYSISSADKAILKTFMVNEDGYESSEADECFADADCWKWERLNYNEANDPDIELIGIGDFIPGIKFEENSSDTNGKGLYIRSGTENNINPIYYYRGAVENNNVYFGNYCWKIVRTTETGGIKMIYNGTPTNGTCGSGVESQANSTIGNSRFHSVNYSDEKYVGYTYDNNNVETDSTIKGVIDTWYQSNILTNYDNYIEDTVYCNDREEATASELAELLQIGFFGSNVYIPNVYKPIVRLKITGIPSLECTNNSDKYTKSNTIGNGKLQYPVGLLTIDEIWLAGIGMSEDSFKELTVPPTYYLNNNSYWWTLSPCYVNIFAYMFSVDPNFGFDYSTNVNSRYRSVRPVISLKPRIRAEAGDGTADNPYIIEME